MLIPAVLIGTAAVVTTGGGQSGVPEYTSDFGLRPHEILLPSGGNQYLSLQPGTRLQLEGEDGGEILLVQITVLRETRPVLFQADGQWTTAITRIVEEREWIDGELTQVSLNYFACSPETGNIFYFGEDVDHYANGALIGHDGAWLAGDKGARPGLFMPGLFLVGSRYCQEMAPGVSMDRAEHVQSGLTVETRAGVFADCVVILETTPLEPGEETLKIYAPNVGLIVDGNLELVRIQRPWSSAR
jgi:hypothetical protein